MRVFDKRYLDQLATVYDKKTVEGLNSKLAEKDHILLNHSGVVLPGKDTSRFQKDGFKESDLLYCLHDLEKDLVVFATKHIGKILSGGYILDAGCGAGESAILINKESGCKIDGYTLSEKQKDFANHVAEEYGVSKTVKFYQGNMLNLENVSSHTFDVVWACESTEHVSRKDLQVMFKEFSRVTIPKSKVVIIAWTSRAGLHKDGKRIKKALDEYYLTDIHLEQDYIAAARKEGWLATETLDLADMTLPYWELRQKSNNATGSEKIFIEGYKNDALSYILYVFGKRNN